MDLVVHVSTSFKSTFILKCVVLLKCLASLPLNWIRKLGITTVSVSTLWYNCKIDLDFDSTYFSFVLTVINKPDVFQKVSLICSWSAWSVLKTSKWTECKRKFTSWYCIVNELKEFGVSFKCLNAPSRECAHIKTKGAHKENYN